MLIPLTDCLKDLLTTACCPNCKREIERCPQQGPFCRACWQHVALPARGLHGIHPYRWTAAGWYDGELRQLILQLRRHPDTRLLCALTEGLGATLPNDAVLVPIPGWKTESRSNPLPLMICRSLQRSTRSLLKRSRPTVGQHHLNRQQRMVNQRGSFAVEPGVPVPRSVRNPEGEALELWLVDDILTSGATAQAAMDALNDQGVKVSGVICLGRTPLGRTR